MIKWIGAMAVIIAMGAIGWLFAGNYQARVKEINQLQHGMRLLETQINYALLPLPRALQQTANQTEAIIKQFFSTAAQKLEQKEELEVAWRYALAQLYEQSQLKSEEITALAQFGQNLGKSDLMQQNKNFNILYTRLDAARLQAEEQQQTKVKIWRYLGFALGCSVVLMIF